MSFKSENWKEILEQVRTGLREQAIVEKTDDELLSAEIDALLENFDAPVVEENLQEITDKEVEALKNLSKDMQSVLKGYQSIVKMGDKELKDSKYNKDYEAVLKARDTIFQLIGKVNTQKTLNKEELELDEGKYAKYSDLLIKKSKLVAQGPIAQPEIDAVNKEIAAEMKKLGIKEEVTKEIVTESKLTEKNMLGRLAKSMELNEENKTKLFDYFDKGELEQ